METIFALSSGAPPAGIAVVRVSGTDASAVLERLAGGLPEPRRASLRSLRDKSGDLLDRALILWLPGPKTVTGEDMAELHLHGGRAIIAAVEDALGEMFGLRKAEPGEFTRRAFTNGRMDLAEAEGLADLLQAETELQRRAALALSEGVLSDQVERWLQRLLSFSAQVEAALDFDDEDDVSELPSAFRGDVAQLAEEIRSWQDGPRAERLREGYRVVLAGPPNSGKSTLFNALVEDEAAITSPIEGTTRDVIERSVAMEGVPFSFVDTAGLRERTDDIIEQVGIERAAGAVALADLVLWLGPEGEGPEAAWEIAAMADQSNTRSKVKPDFAVSAITGAGMDELKLSLIDHARGVMPAAGQVALNARQRDLLGSAIGGLDGADTETDPLLVAEGLRVARKAFDTLTGRASTEDMLDALFGRFCIGK
ncbi:MAG: tRNA uridine-5-carboxymethylaminomethyl(34) synthesis GTPase MnmE [Alteripontixanthobacter sp.]